MLSKINFYIGSVKALEGQKFTTYIHTHTLVSKVGIKFSKYIINIRFAFSLNTGEFIYCHRQTMWKEHIFSVLLDLVLQKFSTFSNYR